VAGRRRPAPAMAACGPGNGASHGKGLNFLKDFNFAKNDILEKFIGWQYLIKFNISIYQYIFPGGRECSSVLRIETTSS
jgi:hypothetical protein